MRVIDGSQGEGGGQILRSTLSLAVLTGEPVRLEKIRAGREKPGLRPQHLTAVRAAAALCGARLEGDRVNSTTLTFEPQGPATPGDYSFDVMDAAEGGSAGAVMLVLQTVLLPLALAEGPSRITLRGGTDVPWSPPSFYIERVYLPTLAQMGVTATLQVNRRGFYPQGGGEAVVELPGRAVLRPVDWEERGALEGIEVVAYVANLPSHIAQRMGDRARTLLQGAKLPVQVEPCHVTAPSPGAGVFILARYENARAGFSALGRKGVPSEAVAEAAVKPLLAYHRGEGALDPHLADQVVLPLVLSGGPAAATVSEVTNHLLTNAWTTGQFPVALARVEGPEGAPGRLVVEAEQREQNDA